MCDIADNASGVEKLNAEIALANPVHPTMQFTGACYYCEKAVQAGFFCDEDSRSDYERVDCDKQHRRVA